MEKVAVLGAGSWGTALAKVLVENGHDVRLWTNNEAQANEINSTHLNQHYLPNLKLPETLQCYIDLQKAVDNADLILFVVPTKAMRSVAQQLREVLTQPAIIAHASKGLELGTHKRLSQILEEEIPQSLRKGVGVLSGPSHAEEVAVHDITTITAASKDLEIAEYIQRVFTNQYFRIYTNTDIIGVEIGAALKNIMAIGAGVIAGLGYGDDAKAALITRGLAEISRFGVAIGANPLTFSGLSGVGDLIVTCTSPHSRNWRCGHQLGEGRSLDEILDHMGMIVEGVSTTKAAYELSKELNVEMPITEMLYQVMYHNADLKESISTIMHRNLKSEMEF